MRSGKLPRHWRDASGFILSCALLLLAAHLASASVMFQPGTPYVGTSGKTVICQFVDALSGQPANLTAYPTMTGVSVAINGTSYTIIDAVTQYTSKTSSAPYVILALPAGTPAITSTATVTLTTPAGWVATTSGSIAASSNQSVLNRAGTEILPAVNLRQYQSMTIGMNSPDIVWFGPGGYYGPCDIWNDLMKGVGTGYGNWATWIGVPSGMTFNAQGLPQSASTTNWTVYAYLCGFAFSNGYGACPVQSPGTYTVQWNGTLGNITLTNGGDSNTVVTEITGDAITGKSTGNQRVYHVTLNSLAPPAYGDGVGTESGASVQLQINFTPPSGSGTANFSNVHVYRAYPVPAGQKLGDPNFLANLRTLSCFRTVGMLVTGGTSAMVDPSDMSAPLDANGAIINTNLPANAKYDLCSYGSNPTQKTYTFPIQSIQQSSSPFVMRGFSAGFQITVANNPAYVSKWNPYGCLKEGQAVNISTVGKVTCSPMGPTKLNFLSYIHIVSSTSTTTTVIAYWWGNGSPQTVTPYTGQAGDVISVTVNQGVPLPALVELANEANVDLWFCLPVCASDANATACASYIAKNLNSAHKCIWELGDETSWLSDYNLCYGEGALEGQNGNYWYAQRAIKLAIDARAAFTAVGRSTSQLAMVMNSPCGGPGCIPDYINVWNSSSPAPGFLPYAVTIAPYYGNQLSNAGFNADHLDLDQSLDIYEVAVDNGPTEVGPDVQSSRAAMVSGGWSNVGFISYEGGAQQQFIGGTLVTNPPAFTYDASRVNYTNLTPNRRSEYSQLHPRMRNIVLHQLQKFQENGMSLFTHFCYCHGISQYVNWPTDSVIWDTYLGTNMKPGLGTGTDGLFNNTKHFGDLLQNVSVEGGALNDWMTAHKLTPPSHLTVKLTAPTNKSTYYTPLSSPITLTASASETNGTIWKVVFSKNGALFGTSLTAPYTFPAPSESKGTYTYSATAYDTLGNSVTSAAVTVTYVNTQLSVSYNTFQGNGIHDGPPAEVPNAMTCDATASNLTRGGNFKPSQYSWMNADFGTWNVTGASAAASLTAGDYAQFSVTANSGLTESLSALTYESYICGGTGNERTGISYSTDGVNWSAPTDITNTTFPTNGHGVFFTITLSGIPALQHITSAYIRIYWYNSTKGIGLGPGGNAWDPSVNAVVLSGTLQPQQATQLVVHRETDQHRRRQRHHPDRTGS